MAFSVDRNSFPGMQWPLLPGPISAMGRLQVTGKEQEKANQETKHQRDQSTTAGLLKDPEKENEATLRSLNMS